MIVRLTRTLRTVCTALGALVFSGCHTWVATEQPPLGSTVRVQWPASREGEEPPRFRGELREAGDTLLIVGNTTRRLARYPEMIRPDTFRIAAETVERLETRELSVVRTAGLTVLFLVGAIAVTAGLGAVFEGDSNGEGGGEIPPPSDARGRPLLLKIPGG